MTKLLSTHPEDTLAKLISVGMALSATHDIRDLLKLITTEARKLTGSDAGSIYIKEADRLRFAVSQCESLDEGTSDTISRPVFKSTTMPISNESIAGHVALTKAIEIIDDAYDLPQGKPYRHSKVFDRENQYQTRSILAVPMLDRKDEVIGVLQLINHLDEEGRPSPYPESVVPLVKALASQAAVALRNAQLREELKQVHYDTILRLSIAAEYKDRETGNHIKRVSKYSRTIAEYMGFSRGIQEMIMAASPMHDIGKIGIPDNILGKPGRFTPEERKIMETHTELGAQIMAGSDSSLLRMCEAVASTHHEKWDGSGYPRRLKGENIPLPGRIVAVADVFDAILSKRVYKEAVPLDEVVVIVKESAGKHFDRACVNAFMHALPIIRDIVEELKD